MLSKTLVSSLSLLPQPLLTVYLGVNPRKQSSHGRAPEYMTWLKSEAKSVAHEVPPPEQPLFQEQLHRVESFLRAPTLKQRGLLILAGPATWTQVPLPLELKNELHWGKPALSQLLNFMYEDKPSCVVVVDRVGGRFFRYRLGELTELAKKSFRIDPSQWKKKEYSHMARRATKMPHGPQRDAFKQRLDAQYRRSCSGAAEETVRLYKKEGLSFIVLVGNARLVEPIEEAFPFEVRRHAVLIKEDLGKLSVRELQSHLTPRFAELKSEFEKKRVDQLLDSDQGTVVGVDETLAQLQDGKTSTVVLVRGFDTSVRQCVKCGLTNRSGDPVCSACRSERRTVMLSEVLPELARTHQTDVEIVDGEAAKRLTESGGIGSWLRQPKKAELR